MTAEPSLPPASGGFLGVGQEVVVLFHLSDPRLLLTCTGSYSKVDRAAKVLKVKFYLCYLKNKYQHVMLQQLFQVLQLSEQNFLSVAGFMWYKGSNLGLHSCRASSPAACGTREAEARVGGHTRHKRRPCLILKAITLKRRCASKYNLRRELQTSVRHHTLLTLKFAGVRILTKKFSVVCMGEWQSRWFCRS